MIKPSIPRGMRDFSPEVTVKRNFIFRSIRKTFEKFGFLPLETPSMENLSVLTGKYGDEGDKLLFKVLNSGDFLLKVEDKEKLISDSNLLSTKISEKGLRYDLTVPFARYVVMNRNEIAFPFKRYQIQPVWRADRPQKGRYREFYQCDADVIGTDSLICEAEIALMVHEAFSKLGLRDYVLKFNSRKILEGIAEIAGESERSETFFVALDKLDKIGLDGVKQELYNRDFSDDFVKNLVEIISFTGSNKAKIEFLKKTLKNSKIGTIGIEEVEKVLLYINSFVGEMSEIDFDFNLARGLSYYTGIIFEARATNVKIGSIGGGGRYDNLTGVFGMPDVSGVGFSFGIDRIYDVMDELQLFDSQEVSTTKVLITNFEENAEKFALRMLYKIRAAGINAEIYPDTVKLKKQLNYANKKNIPYVLIIGPDELKKAVCTLKDMVTGDQAELSIEELIKKLVAEKK
ncbi:MAG: histidine--tRNA ligase [Cyclobacteriaceae bacterium]|jgi:histidyl-tRNA synthetase